MPRGRILVVDDEESIRTTLRQILEDEGYSVTVCEDGETALKLLDKGDFEIVLLDVWLPGMDGIQVMEEMNKQRRTEEVLMISGHGTIDTAVRATRVGAYDFIEKPLSLERVLVGVQNALQKHRLEEGNRLLKDQLGEETQLVGESPAIQNLKEQIRRAAPTEGRVLVFGENGTGKELVARLIHAHSNRTGGPFVELNCAAIPQELIESELFGHRKGSFTGAIENKKGKFLLANGGTLFLDEVGDMSLMTQAKVLRALQEQTIEPVGGEGSLKVDVRVIAATNKDLQLEIEEGNFREDLYYRLSVIPLVVPPLRERKEDIPLIFDYYSKFYGQKYGVPPKTLTDKAREALMGYAWPGNVRELRNLAERVMIMHPDVEVDPRHLPLGNGTGTGPELVWEGSLKDAREHFEHEFIRRALIRNDWNVSRSAEELQIERRHLYRRMAALGIQKENGHGHG